MKKRLLLALTGLLAVLGTLAARAQGSIPFTINNNSSTANTDLYAACVGIDTNGNHVWINLANSQVLPMDKSYNTVSGPTVNGNTGPGGNSKYAACFTKLSAIPNRTFTLPYIAGCRVYISRGQQLYFYFFGANGATSGYAAPNPQNSSDPNTGIIYETIELTNNGGGFFGNTTRVDAFNFPMGLELYGNNSYYKKTGELLSAADIVSKYKSSVPTEFQGTVNSSTGVITFPSKTPAFYDGTNGTTAGQYGNYFKSYLDAIWAKYKNEDLIFNAGNAGVFKGRVGSDNRLVVVGQSGAYNGRTGIISREPTTQEAFEGKGVLAQRNNDGDCDLVVQAQITAAVNRHAISAASAAAGQQNFYDVSKFYQTAPMNYYARFWHLPGVSVDNLSYGFAYDDVADQSSTLQTPQPTKVVATWGGFVGQSSGGSSGSGVATFYKDCNYGGTAVALPTGTYTLSQLQAKGIANDDISSLQVSSGYSVTLYADDNFGGASLGVTGNNSCLVNNALGSGNWNDQTSSLKVQSAYSVQLEAENANVNNGMQVETCSDTGGGQDMGYIDQGDYLVWNNINFPSTGSYLIEYRVASGANGGTISSDLNAGNTQLGNTSIPGTGGWQTWTTVSKSVSINAGTYNFGVYAQTGGYNLNWVRITYQGSTARTANALATTSAATDSQFGLFPNPTRGVLNLEVAPVLLGRSFRILNNLGQLVRSGQLATGQLDLSALPGGLYLLSVPAQGDAPGLSRRFLKE